MLRPKICRASKAPALPARNVARASISSAKSWSTAAPSAAPAPANATTMTSTNNFLPARLHIYLVLFPVAFFFASSVLAHPRSQAPKMLAGTEDDIREAIVLFQMDGLGGEENYFCLTLEDKDPTAQLLMRFQNRRASVHAESVCSDGAGSKRRRVSLWQGAIHRTSRDSVKVRGGYRCGLTCGAKGTFVLSRKNTGWRVAKFKASV